MQFLPRGLVSHLQDAIRVHEGGIVGGLRQRVPIQLGRLTVPGNHGRCRHIPGWTVLADVPMKYRPTGDVPVQFLRRWHSAWTWWYRSRNILSHVTIQLCRLTVSGTTDTVSSCQCRPTEDVPAACRHIPGRAVLAERRYSSFRRTWCGAVFKEDMVRRYSCMYDTMCVRDTMCDGVLTEMFLFSTTAEITRTPPLKHTTYSLFSFLLVFPSYKASYGHTWH